MSRSKKCKPNGFNENRRLYNSRDIPQLQCCALPMGQPHACVCKSKYKKVGVLPIRIVQSNISSFGSSSERNRTKKKSFYFLFVSDEGPMLETLDYHYPYWQYTDIFIFPFVSLLCLRSTLRLFRCLQLSCQIVEL